LLRCGLSGEGAGQGTRGRVRSPFFIPNCINTAQDDRPFRSGCAASMVTRKINSRLVPRGSPPTYNSSFFIESTAKSAALAVRAMKVSEGFTQEVEVMHAPSVMKTFFTTWIWL